jgi:hypothetical protein
MEIPVCTGEVHLRGLSQGGRTHPLFSRQGFSTILEKLAAPLKSSSASETATPESAQADFAGTDRDFNPGAYRRFGPAP